MKRFVLIALAALPAACSDGPTTPVPVEVNPALGVGQSNTVSGGAASSMTVRAGSGPGEYLLVVSHLSESGTAALGVEVSGTGLASAALAVEGPGLRSAGLPGAHAEAVPDGDFHQRLRESEIRELGARMRSGVSRDEVALQARSGPLSATPAVGDLLRLNTVPSCTASGTLRTGRVAALSQRAVIVADTANPAGGFTDADYAAIAAHFDASVHPLVVGNFGEPTDIDGNGRVVIFFTRAVNELTDRNSESYVGGFFWGGDLFPRESTRRAEACPNSNFGEIFYMLVPDPQGRVNGNVRTKAFVERVTPGVLAHEYQHLVNAARRLHVNSAPGFEEVWLNEGLSHIAEELMFYQEAGLAPRRNLDADDLRQSERVVNAFNRYASANFARLRQYLERPRENTPLGRDVLATRGATWQLLRYAADRHGGPEPSLWMSLTNSTRAGLANLRNALGADPLPWIHDWSVAIVADDAVPGIAERHRQPSWNFRTIFQAIDDGAEFPLQPETLGSSPRTFSVQGGSSAHLVFRVAPGDEATIRITSGGATPPSTLSASIVRMR
jgi:hypothetical protein